MAGHRIYLRFFIHLSNQKSSNFTWNHDSFLCFIPVAAFNALFFVAVYYIPESPCYLFMKGHEQKAEDTLNFLDIDLSAMATMQLSPVSEDKDKGESHIWSKMTNSANYKPFISGIILMTFFQVLISQCGYYGNLISLYSSKNFVKPTYLVMKLLNSSLIWRNSFWWE